MYKYVLQVVVAVFILMAVLNVFHVASADKIIDRGYIKCYIWEPTAQMGHISVKVVKKVAADLYLVTYNKSTFQMTADSKLAELWLRKKESGSCRVFFMPQNTLNLPITKD